MIQCNQISIPNPNPKSKSQTQILPKPKSYQNPNPKPKSIPNLNNFISIYKSCNSFLLSETLSYQVSSDLGNLRPNPNPNPNLNLSREQIQIYLHQIPRPWICCIPTWCFYIYWSIFRHHCLLRIIVLQQGNASSIFQLDVSYTPSLVVPCSHRSRSVMGHQQFTNVILNTGC